MRIEGSRGQKAGYLRTASIVTEIVQCARNHRDKGCFLIMSIYSDDIEGLELLERFEGFSAHAHLHQRGIPQSILINDL